MATHVKNPRSQSELQLYRVLQRANLLQYYEVFINQGGDDVQQLCEAGEDEFLEIMDLVGMAAKPLHVRRLQKGLQEWLANPGMFNVPLSQDQPGGSPGVTPISIEALRALRQESMMLSPTISASPASTSSQASDVKQPNWGSEQNHNNNMGHNMYSNGGHGMESVNGRSFSPNGNGTSDFGMNETQSSRGNSPAPHQSAELSREMKMGIRMAAEQMAKTLPPTTCRPANQKKGIFQEMHNICLLDENDPTRWEGIKKYSAIYGRFDSKSRRKNERPMTLHEISVNEAASQICRFCPALMTRRDELFPLARQVVRDSGYQFSKGHSRRQRSPNAHIPSGILPLAVETAQIVEEQFYDKSLRAIGPDGISPLSKRPRMDPRSFKNDQRRLAEISTQLSELGPTIEFLRSQLSSEENTRSPESLGIEIENLTRRQQILESEQGDILDKLNSMTMMGNNNEEDSMDSQGHLTGNATQPAQNGVSLYDEGLRIAAQYGLNDLAGEIGTLQTTNHQTIDPMKIKKEIEQIERMSPIIQHEQEKMEATKVLEFEVSAAPVGEPMAEPVGQPSQ